MNTSWLNAIGFLVLGVIGVASLVHGVPPGASQLLTGITTGIIGALNIGAAAHRSKNYPKDPSNPQ